MARTGENIYKRKDGRWEGRYIFFYKADGKAKYKSVYGRTYSEVKRKLLIAQTGSPVSKHNYNLTEKYSYWLDKYLASKKLFIKESTYIRYKNHIENHIKPELGKYSVNKISTSLVEEFVSNKLLHGRLDNNGGLSQKTMSDILGIIKGSFEYSRSHGIATVCSFDNISFKSVFRGIRVLSESEERNLLKVLLKEVDRCKAGVLICLCTGIRIGELCALQSKHISLADKTLRISQTMQRIQCEYEVPGRKTKIVITSPKSFSSGRIIPLLDFVVDIISPFLSFPDTYFLTGDSKCFIEPRTMQNKFKAYLKEAQITAANFHSLRHTFATRCIEAGFDAKSLSEILGHSSVKITLDRYVHSSMQLKRCNMEKLQTLIV